MAAKIGNRKHATAAITHHHSVDRSDNDEFRRLGSGAFRTAYLHVPSGVVYKVENNARYAKSVDMGNRREQRNASRLSKRTYEHIYIPLVSLFIIGDDHVAAMEHVEGIAGMSYRSNHPGNQEWWNLPPRARVRDMHGGNYIIRSSDDKFVPIDLAS